MKNNAKTKTIFIFNNINKILQRQIVVREYYIY
jgi:hypothetical protein